MKDVEIMKVVFVILMVIMMLVGIIMSLVFCTWTYFCTFGVLTLCIMFAWVTLYNI